MKARVLFPFLVAALFLTLTYAVYAKPPRPAPETPGDTTDWTPATNPSTDVVVAQLTAENARLRAQRARLYTRVRSLKRVLLHQPRVGEALNLACVAYGNCATLWRRARCESHLFAGAHNPSGASGLLQFLPSTWASTPYWRFSVYSPYANALAAGWMIGPAHRGGEWTCR